MMETKTERKLVEEMKSFFRSITIEPCMFCYAFSFAILAVTQVTFMMDKICRTERKFPDDVCDNLLKDESLLSYKQRVQEDLSEWLTILNYMQDIPSLILSVMIGPWSDKYGRKKPMLLVMILRTVTFGGFLLNAIFRNIPTYGIILSYIPTCSFGGFIFMLCLSYVTDVTSPQSRTKRISVLSGSAFLGFPIGILIGAFIFESGGYIAVYVTSTSIMFVATIYVATRIEETRGDGKITLKAIGNFFSLENVKEAVRTVVKKREGNKRWHLLTALSCLGLVAIAFSVSGITYQYTQLMYTWGNKDYSIFSSTTSFFNKLVNLFITPMLSGKFEFKETSIGILGIQSMIIAMITISLAKVAWIFWIGGVLDGVVFMSSVTSRSILSFSVHSSEVGKAFGIASACESIGGFIGGVAVQQLYKATLVYFPSCAFFMSGFVCFIMLCAYLWIDVDMRRTEKMKVTSATSFDDEDENVREYEQLRIKSASLASGLNLDEMTTRC